LPSSKLQVRARVLDGFPPREIIVAGKKARSLLALAKAGPRGVTALEVAGTWAMRFATYCHLLHRDHGIQIRCEQEKHEGGWHGRHVLVTPVAILEVVEPR
jgi:hypothetical protein